MKNNNTRAFNITFAAMLMAVAIVLSIVESALPNIMPAVPGVKLGLSNIVVMYALFFVNYKSVFSIVILKGFFAFMTRGMVAGALSFTGGMLSVVIMIIISFISKKKASYLILSIFGAISHNIGQFIIVIYIYKGMNINFYLPVLIISGLIAGLVTSMVLRVTVPHLGNINNNIDNSINNFKDK